MSIKNLIHSTNRVSRLGFSLILGAFFAGNCIAQESASSRSALVEVADGKSVQVTLRKFQPADPPIESASNLSQMYGPLVEAANGGDVASARVLGNFLDSCNSAFDSDEALEQAIEKLRQDGIREFGDGRDAVEVTRDGDIANIETGMRQKHDFCRGIPKSDTSTAVNWSRQAAKMNDYLGIQQLARHLGESDESFNLWHKAWEQGHAAAAQELVYYYRFGIPTYMGGEPDNYLAHVYQLVAFTVKTESFGSKLDPDFEREINRALSDSAALLSPAQQADAEDEAARILTANKNCCIVWTLESG